MTSFESRMELRKQINALMDVTSGVRNLLANLDVPGSIAQKLLAVEDESWKILRDSLASYYEGQ